MSYFLRPWRIFVNRSRITYDMLHHTYSRNRHSVCGAQVTALCAQFKYVGVKDGLPQKKDTVENVNDSLIESHSVSPVKIYSKDRDGDTLLHISIILQNENVSMYFISKSQTYKWLSIRNKLFQTPLHLAVLTNQVEVARRLVVGGADVTSRDRDGNTVLHIACRDGLLDIVKILVEPVRYSEIKQNIYEIPYQAIPQDFTLRNYEGMSCLHLADLDKDIMRILIEKGIDLNMKEGKTGRTVLHNSCLRGDVSVVKLLLSKKACDINARAYDGSTPFDLARARRHDDACEALAAAGARYGEDYTDSD